MTHSSEDCIFCKIVNGDIPGAKVYEDEHVLAFFDISQVTKGHTLVIPKNHEENVYELKEETASRLFAAVPKVARALKQTFEPIGLNILNNNGEKAGQSVFHYHLHLIPRYGKGDGFGSVWKEHGSEYSPEQLSNMAAEVKKHIQLS
ncbi:HIT family protein [Alteribacter natronophilus]|uniref:HIT family protein n=1 Tax=Alteribacter natronophilus TaxID=2583810 RepID=UPI00110D3385|nr:HIT family protein [Alteribacter natronophilus]TMW74003.1 HIT family protein [Alteribacter natronophilus]